MAVFCPFAHVVVGDANKLKRRFPEATREARVAAVAQRARTIRYYFLASMRNLAGRAVNRVIQRGLTQDVRVVSTTGYGHGTLAAGAHSVFPGAATRSSTRSRLVCGSISSDAGQAGLVRHRDSGWCQRRSVHTKSQNSFESSAWTRTEHR
jgi:hypothetical protein